MYILEFCKVVIEPKNGGLVFFLYIKYESVFVHDLAPNNEQNCIFIQNASFFGA